MACLLPRWSAMRPAIPRVTMVDAKAIPTASPASPFPRPNRVVTKTEITGSDIATHR